MSPFKLTAHWPSAALPSSTLTEQLKGEDNLWRPSFSAQNMVSKLQICTAVTYAAPCNCNWQQRSAQAVPQRCAGHLKDIHAPAQQRMGHVLPNILF
jgi:hypothetical protein